MCKVVLYLAETGKSEASLLSVPSVTTTRLFLQESDGDLV